MLSKTKFFTDPLAYVDEVKNLRPTVIADETSLALAPSVAGWCDWCNHASIFVVPSGASFGNRSNLREGMRCTRCKLTNRQRLIACAITEHTSRSSARIAIAEQSSRLYRSIKRRHPTLYGSEYLGPDKEKGRTYLYRTSAFRPRFARHEDITDLSFASESLDVFAHSDVLEHVYDYQAALRESFRVLTPGGVLVFTAPYFYDNAVSVLLGRPRPDGSQEHFFPPEYHGDGVTGKGIYTYHHFGRDIITLMQSMGFSNVTIALRYAPHHGFASANAEEPEHDMLPMYFRAVK
jgi:SAM-dependent methyltransferase